MKKPFPIRPLASLLICLGLLTTALLAQQSGNTVLYDAPSKYQKITVLDTPTGMRQMIFDGRFDGTDAIQSEMKKSDPAELTLAYSRNMIASLPLAAKPKRILIIGLGGACIERYLYKVMPEVKIETVELDPDVAMVAKKFFELKEDDRQVVHIDDGRKFIEKSKDKYDVILLDAFSATSIPYALSTREFLTLCKDHLNEGGLLAANLWYAVPEYSDMLKTYDAVFAEWKVIKCAGSTNAILTALPTKQGITREKWMDAANTFNKTYKTGLNLADLINIGIETTTIIPPTAKVLLDKDAPKDN